MRKGTRVYAEAVVNPGPATVIRPLEKLEFVKWFGPIVKNSKRHNQVWIKVDKVPAGHCPFVLIERKFLRKLNRHITIRPRKIALHSDTLKFRLGRGLKRKRRI